MGSSQVSLTKVEAQYLLEILEEKSAKVNSMTVAAGIIKDIQAKLRFRVK